MWDELDARHPQVDIYRRTLQTQYLYTIDGRINGASATKTDLNAIERESLRKLAGTIDKSIPKASNEPTARHLRNCRRLIALIVEGKMPQPAGGAAGYSPSYFGASATDGCWPDLALPEFRKSHD